MCLHADGPTKDSQSSYAAASAGVAVSKTPYGPFRFIERYRLNTCPADQEDMYPQSKGMARDMNLFTDDDGTAYIIYSSEENLTLNISRLNDSYTREAPALFKRDGVYYLMTSGCIGWAPNQARYYRAASVLGEWENCGDPCIEDTKQTTFDSQSTCIFVADDNTWIYMGDRWYSDDLANSGYIWLPQDDLLDVIHDTISYDEYLAKYAQAAHPDKSITVKGVDYSEASAGFYKEADGLCTLEEGSVTYEIEVEQAGLYQIQLSYYPLEGKNGTIKRIIHKRTLVSTREPMKIGAITLTQEKPLQAYEEYCKSNEAAGYTAVADVSVTVQAEDAVYKSDSTLYPITDRESLRLMEKFPSWKPESVSSVMRITGRWHLFSSLVCWNYGNLSPYRFSKTVPEAYVLEDVERVDMARKMEIPAYDYECTRIFYELGTDFSFDINNIFQRIMTGTQPLEEVWEEIIQEYKNNGLMEVIDKVNKVRKEKSPKE